MKEKERKGKKERKDRKLEGKKCPNADALWGIMCNLGRIFFFGGGGEYCRMYIKTGLGTEIVTYLYSPVYMRVLIWIQPRFTTSVNVPKPDCNPD